MNDRTDIKSLNLEELTGYIKSLGEPAYRAKQIYEWLHIKLIKDFDSMSNISKSLREKLRDNAFITEHKQVRKLISEIDGTEKYLFELSDGNVIESVLMRYEHGLSVCISSQVGCRMGCRFCASTIDGLARNLTPSEMLDEVYSIQREHEERINHIVLMGSGEPLDNYDTFLRFIEMITDENGLNISRRNITVSTCGIVEKIYDLAERNTGITLAISLHAPNDEIRRQTMPIANKYSISDILKACKYFFEKTGRRITFEYTLVDGVNDSKENASELAAKIKPLSAHVNLIPVNPIEERDYKQSSSSNILAFKNMLEKSGINVTIRREMGRDINGACGQLRRHYESSRKD